MWVLDFAAILPLDSIPSIIKNKTNSQGGVQVPTGGKARERFPWGGCRSGASPEPTVTVRKKENSLSDSEASLLQCLMQP